MTGIHTQGRESGRVSERHPLRDPVFAGYFVHGFAAFCPRCWGTRVGWDSCLWPGDEQFDEPVCIHYEPADEELDLHAPSFEALYGLRSERVPMVTLYTAGLDERPPRGTDLSALWVKLVRRLG